MTEKVDQNAPVLQRLSRDLKVVFGTRSTQAVSAAQTKATSTPTHAITWRIANPSTRHRNQRATC